MNAGLKTYTKQLTQVIGSVANVSFNINEDDANFHIILPLLKTIGLSPIDLSLIYNRQDNEKLNIFGKGVKINLFSKLIIETDKIKVKNADGSIDIYSSSNNYKNYETQTTIEKIYDDEYQTTYHYKMTDKFGNYKLYSSVNLEYPYYIKTTSNDIFSIDFVATTKKISNNKGDVVEFSLSSGFVDTIIYKHNDVELYQVRLRYMDNYLADLEHLKESTTIASCSIEYSENKIIVSDYFANYRIKYNLSSNKVVSYIDAYGFQFDDSKATKITYEKNKTVITNCMGKINYVFFDNNSLPLFEMDSEGDVVETEYDENLKVLTAQSSIVRTKNRPTNLFPGQSLSYFTKDNGVTLSDPYSVTSSFFNTILGSTVCKLSGNGKVSYTLANNGLATDNIQAIILGRQLSSYTSDSYVKVTLSADSEDFDIFKKTVCDDNFDLMTLGINAKFSFKNITLTIELKGDASIEIGGIQVLKKDFGSFFGYDESGNPNVQTSGTGSNNISYNSNNQVSSSQSADSTMYDFEYDSKGNLLKAKTAYGVAIENEYDDNNNLTKNRVKNNSLILETEKSYDSNGFLTSEKDELGNQTSYLYDSFGKVVQVTDALNSIIKYNYDVYDNLKQIILQKDSNTISVSYTYDSRQRVKTISLRNDSYYEFEYDSKDNLIKVLLNNVVIFEYEYDSDNAIVLQKYGENGDAFKFEYNSEKELVKVYYVSSNNVSSLKYTYEYNDFHQIETIKNASGTILNSYSYDIDGRIIKMTSTNEVIDYQYDNLGNANEKTTLVNGNKIYQSYDNIARSKGSSPEAIVDTLGNMGQARVATFVSDAYARGKKNTIKCLSDDYTESNVTLTRDGVIPCAILSSTSTKRITYLLPDSQMADTCGMAGFWFKPTNITTKQYLFSQKRRAGNGFIGAYIQNSKIYVEVINENGNKYTIITSNSLVNINKWNFFAIDYIYRNDTGYSEDYINQIDLILNSQRQSFIDKTGTYHFDQGTDTVYHIGHSYDNSSYTSFLGGKIALLMMGNNRCIDLKQIIDYYRITKDYIIDNQLVDSSIKSVDFCQTNLHTINSTIQKQFEIYPLQTSVKSLNGKIPTSFDIRKVSENDKDRTFNFNNINKHYSYVTDGSTLEYDFGQSSTGTIVMRAFTDVDNDKQYFLEGLDSSNHKLGLFRNENGKLCVDLNGNTLISSLTFSTNIWHTVGISFDREVQTDSEATITYQKIRIYLDGNEYSFNELVFFNYSTLKFMIGRVHNSKNIISNLGSYETTYPLYGQIEMLATRNSYCDISTINTLKEELIDISKVSEFDELGLLQKVDLHKNGNSIMSNTYSYKKRSNTTYSSKQISKEVIKYGSTTVNRSYTTDALGNVTKVTDSTFGSHTYQYDYRGYLINEDDTEYSYDENGNITKAGSVEFTYDTIIKDRLVSINGKSITYSSSNPGNPSCYDGKNYSFEGRRLKSISSSDNYGGEDTLFEYNDQGLRISKTQHYWYNDDRYEEEETTYYYYDGDNLVCQIDNSRRFDFLYDENGQLYGFIKDQNTKYFYIRDFMQNIHGIIDESGSLVVKYKYDAYGNLQSMEDTSGISLGLYNPFKYKGYYYDFETNLYYCKSRYYVPEWRRWLNNDSTSIINIDNIFSLNIYAYCLNNPVLLVDTNGNWGLNNLWSCVLTGVIAVAAVATIAAVTVASGGAATPVIVGAIVGSATSVAIDFGTQLAETRDISKIDGTSLIMSACTGAVTGALGCSCFGRLGNALGTGISDGVANIMYCMANDKAVDGSILIDVVQGFIFGLCSKGSQGKELTYNLNKHKIRKKRFKNKPASLRSYKKSCKIVARETKRFTLNAMKKDKIDIFIDISEAAINYFRDVLIVNY